MAKKSKKASCAKKCDKPSLWDCLYAKAYLLALKMQSYLSFFC